MLRIEEIMKSKGIGVTELAKKMNVSRMTIYYYIKQDEKNSISQLKKIADALDCDLGNFFEQPATDVIICPKCGAKLSVVEKK